MTRHRSSRTPRTGPGCWTGPARSAGSSRPTSPSTGLPAAIRENAATWAAVLAGPTRRSGPSRDVVAARVRLPRPRRAPRLRPAGAADARPGRRRASPTGTRTRPPSRTGTPSRTRPPSSTELVERRRGRRGALRRRCRPTRGAGAGSAATAASSPSRASGATTCTTSSTTSTTSRRGRQGDRRGVRRLRGGLPRRHRGRCRRRGRRPGRGVRRGRRPRVAGCSRSAAARGRDARRWRRSA